MKYIKLFEDFFNKSMIVESKQVGTVYHFTSLSSLFKILKSGLLKGKLPTSPNIPYVAKQKGKLYISTTRDKNFIKHRDVAEVGGDHVALVLDGNKLSSNYKTMSFNDTWDAKDKEWGDWATVYGDEMEQLWYGSKLNRDGGIKNISRYLKSIIITKRAKSALLNLEVRHIPDELLAKFDWNSTPQEKMKILKEFIIDLVGNNIKIKY